MHLAGPRAREERQRHPLQVAIDRRAQVMHHALADGVRQIGLPDAEHGGRDRDRDHPADGLLKHGRVVLEQAHVEHCSQQEWRDHAQPGREHDQPNRGP
jgi:hypothetical protein